MRALLKKKHEEDELRHSNIRCTHGDPEDDDEEEEDGCIYILTKGAKKGRFCGKAVVAKDLCKLHQDF